ncbi:MAG: ATPase [Planctomycetes bacterium RBG_13_60_9]|nr:MAG: ATPase [Planctomycetes bacterium RBG_13_60_9]
MIRLIEVLNYRCLHYIRQPLGRFHVLVGPNASGKTTFLDVIAFLGRMVSDGLDAAIDERTRNFVDLLWRRDGTSFELAVEADIQEARTTQLNGRFNAIRYEIAIGVHPDTNEVGILQERAILRKQSTTKEKQRSLFPMEPQPASSIMTERSRKGEQTVLSKGAQGNDNYYAEVRDESGGKGWIPSFRLGPKRSALGNLPEDESRFPASTWFKRYLMYGVETFVLNSLMIRRASPPGQGTRFKPDGSNLPWVIENLRGKGRDRFEAWIRHLQTALPDVTDISTVERPDDKHRYLKVHYQNGLEVPSWMVSDGTLRLLALTLPAYIPEFTGVYLVEEPENGLHPGAIETLFQSLSSVYSAQMLLATHSPVILSTASLEQVLCFKKTDSGATDIVAGPEHPALRDWKGQPNLDVIFTSGVLG